MQKIHSFLELIMQHFDDHTDEIALCDEAHPEGICYGELRNLSGKVYTFLKNNKIGREQVVMINLPRGIEIVIAFIGVWRAGAAVTIVESDQPVERTGYIYEDSGCVCKITEDVYSKIMDTCEPSEGYEDFDLHDAAYVVYTSGTTGKPKGVVHEMGKLGICDRSSWYQGEPIMKRDDILSLISPLNFVGSMAAMIGTIGAAACIDIVPYDTVKNPVKLKEHMIRRKTTAAFMPISLINALTVVSAVPEGKSPFNREFKKLIIGAEGIKNIWFEDLDIYNAYAQTESLYFMCVFKVDKKYDVTPVGRCWVEELGAPVIIDEQDGIGEICVLDPYCRGYIGRDNGAVVDSDGLLHTGDIGKKADTGDFIILGRSDDMIKINGNRIEPGEIEEAVKKVLGVAACASRAFQKNGRAYICAYYTDEVSFDEADVIQKLRKYLPDYMIPNYFMKIDKLPLSSTGKLSRKDLPDPAPMQPAGEYEPPENETEELICKAMAKVLGIKRIGRNDDFYKLGGDSLRTMALVSEPELLGLSTRDVFRERTPKKLAAYYINMANEKTDVDILESEMKARKNAYPLTAFQKNIYDIQMLEPASLMWVMPQLFLFEHPEEERLVNAVNELKENSPVFGTMLEEGKSGEILQRYVPEAITKTVIENFSEEQLLDLKKNFNDPDLPFVMLGRPLAKIRLLRTEKGVYMLILFHHIMLDGKGGEILLDRFLSIYNKEPYPKDTYYSFLQSEMERAKAEDHKRASQELNALYDNVEWTTELSPVGQSRSNEAKMLSTFVPISEERLSFLEKETGVSRTGLFMAVIILALAKQTRKRDILINWVYSNRGDPKSDSIAGFIIRSLAMGIRLDDCKYIKDVFNSIKEQIILNIALSEYEWCLNNPPKDGEDRTFFVYEGLQVNNAGLSAIGGKWVPFELALNQAVIHHMSAQAQAWNMNGTEGFILVLFYIANMYQAEEMQQFERYLGELSDLIFMKEDCKELPVDEILDRETRQK